MKRRMILLILVLLLVLVFNSTALADNGDAPHSGRCVAHCSRAYIIDFNGDGKLQNCLLETNCHKDTATPCGEHIPERAGICWDTCIVLHGAETHLPGD